jgi:hypothetical protein
MLSHGWESSNLFASHRIPRTADDPGSDFGKCTSLLKQSQREDTFTEESVMARGEPVILKRRSFQSKKEAQEYFRMEISSRDVGTEITSQEEFFADIRSLIERHPEREQKVGVGIEAFIVRLDDNRNKMLWLRRTDGSSTDFSYITCIRGNGMSLRQEFAEAARKTVEPHITEFRDDYVRRFMNPDGQIPCEETGVLMNIKDSHVDHFPVTFQTLVDQFLDQTSIGLTRNILSAPADRQTHTSFVCPKTAAMFLDFHRSNATLKVVHKTVNLKRKRKA